MFIGHFGAGFTGKKFSKTASRGTYFMAAQWLIILWGYWVDRNREAK